VGRQRSGRWEVRHRGERRETGGGVEEGSGKREAGSGKREAGSGKREAGSGKREAGERRQGGREAGGGRGSEKQEVRLVTRKKTHTRKLSIWVVFLQNILENISAIANRILGVRPRGNRSLK
jgi:hypothetical protein